MSSHPFHQFRAKENDIYAIFLKSLPIIPPVPVCGVQKVRERTACSYNSDELAVRAIESAEAGILGEFCKSSTVTGTIRHL